MTVQKIDGYSLINIDVPLPTANPPLALLTVCLTAVSSWVNLASYALEKLLARAVDYVKLLVRVAENVGVRRDYRSEARLSLTSGLDPGKLSSINVALADTEAKIIISGDLETVPRPSRYVLVFDCSRAELRTGQFSIINIAAKNDTELFDCIRLSQTLNSRSFTGAVRQLFSLYVPTLAWDTIYYDSQGMLSGHALHRESSIYPPWYTYPTDKDFPAISSDFLNHFFHHYTCLPPHEDFIVGLLPQRAAPLSELDLHDELIYGPLPAVLIERRLSWPRVALVLILLPSLAIIIPLLSFMFRANRDALDMGTAWAFLSYLLAMCSLIIQLLCMKPSIHALLARILELKRWPWYNGKTPKPGVHRTRFACECGHHMSTERKVNEADKDIVWKLYQSHVQHHADRKSRIMGHTKAGDPVMASGKTPANRLSSHPMISLGPRGDPLASEGSGQDIVDAVFDLPSKGEGESSSKMHSKQVQNGESDNKSPRFFVFCSPSSNGRQMYQSKSTTPHDRPSDHVLIMHIKKVYMSNRSTWRRLMMLRSFSAIKLSRFELFHSRTSGAIPIALKTWEWPTKPKEGEPEWEYADGSYDPLSEEGIADFMLHKWINDCSPIKDESDKTADLKQRRTILSFRMRDEPSLLPRTYPLRIPPSLSKLRLPQHITIWLPNLHILKQDKGKSVTKAEIDESFKQWHIDFDYKDTLGDTRYTYHRTPKKLRTPLEPDKSGQNPPVGWGIWIEEDFVFPWYLPLLLMALVIGMLIFSAWYSNTRSPKTSAWAIGGYVLAAVALPVTGWMTWAKDSKHARI